MTPKKIYVPSEVKEPWTDSSELFVRGKITGISDILHEPVRRSLIEFLMEYKMKEVVSLGFFLDGTYFCVIRSNNENPNKILRASAILDQYRNQDVVISGFKYQDYPMFVCQIYKPSNTHFVNNLPKLESLL